MDLFSLVSPEKKKVQGNEDQGGEDDVHCSDDLLMDHDNDGFETPRSTEWSSSSTPMTTPRSLFSSPPRSPPKTPPRPTSHVDDRIRLRRFKLSMSPSHSPIKARCSGGGLLSEPLEDPPLCHRDSMSFSSAGDENWNESNVSFPSSSPNVTPNNSPRRGDLLSLSPLQERLARARTKRQAILDERVQNIDIKSKEASIRASKLKEDATLEKIEKARTEESIIQAKSKRQAILDERVQKIHVKSKLKETEASKRKEDVTLEKVERARTELAKSPIAKERRDQQLTLRVESLEATLESKTAMAEQRLERHLLEKQQRACCKERKERAERRRKLISYEKRAKLLAALDAKLERAALKNHKLNEEKSIRARDDIAKAKIVSRKVKAARVIQAMVREAYGIESPTDGSSLDLSHHAAAERLQRWFQWRAHVCKRRLFVSEESDGTAPKATTALEQLLEMFPLSPQRNQLRRPSSAPPFELLSHKMMQPETLKMAIFLVDCLRPINEVSFGSSDGSADAAGPVGKSSPKIDGRTLLSLSLIAVHPREVLGDDCDQDASTGGSNNDSRSSRGSRLLISTSRALLQSLNELLAWTKTEQDPDEHEQFQILNQISHQCMRALTLFEWWKCMDKEQLLEGLSKQLKQTWVVYLTSSETLKYLAEVTGVKTAANSPSKKDDPLMSLRIRHEAGRSGSRSHIKRIRLMMNKLIGNEEGKEVVKHAKNLALKEIDDTNALNVLKGEIDEIYPGLLEENAIAGNASGALENDQGKETVQGDDNLAMSVDLPDGLLSNRILVHKILLTDPADFGTLSWNGTNAQSSNVGPGEFMASFIPQSAPHEQHNDATQSMDDMPMRIAQSMRMAFFKQIAGELGQGNYEPVQELLKELHTKMRSLLPSRNDLHSHINDEDISSCSSVSAIVRVLIRSGYLLANYLESEARAPTTRELIEGLEVFNSGPHDDADVSIPYGVESEEMFVVASIAYLLHKAELCQIDVSNYKLSQAAPLLHVVGNDYERKQFQKTFGDFMSSSIEELQHMLPSTWNWIKSMQALYGNSENLTLQSNLAQKMDFVKGRGFVDGVLFTRSQLALPEFLSLDVDSINHIRSEARCCVIASALALHACNISKVGTSVLSSSVMTDEVNDARKALSYVLRKKHFDQNELESNVIKAIGTLTTALAERDLAEEEVVTLKSHTLAVLHGNDPVLKLLDNRVQSFFRFSCKWKSDAATYETTAPLEMKTGRSILKTDNIAAARHGIKSTKGDFTLAAKREASRLGFAYFGSDLIEVGDEARTIISLACANYGPDILDRFLGVAWEDN
ncbi:hypothetical protein ACHAXR_009701 [Thalassiosira sp. AJA248-18]